MQIEAIPFWLYPIEQMTPEAIEIMCDADRRPKKPMDTLIIRMQPCAR